MQSIQMKGKSCKLAHKCALANPSGCSPSSFFFGEMAIEINARTVLYMHHIPYTYIDTMF